MTSAELADLLHLTPATIRNRVCEGKEPRPFKCGGKLLFDRAEVAAWIQRQRIPARKSGAK